MTEAQLQQTIVEAARLCGWLVHHARPAQTRRGWRTPITGNVGFPDLILAKPRGRCFALELKGDGGRFGPGQQGWLDSLDGAVISARIVWPADLDALLAAITNAGEGRQKGLT